MIDIAAKNEKSLRQLAQAIALSRGQFKLILVRCNYRSLSAYWSQRLEAETQRQHQFSLLTADLPVETQNLAQVIERAMDGETAEGIQLRGMTQLADLRGFLAKANQMRDQLRHKFAFPIVLWLDETGLREMLEVANDLESWTTSKRFLPSAEDIQANLELNVQQFLSRLQGGSDRQWLGRDCLLGENQQREIEQACQKLAQLGEPLSADLAADLALIQGRQALEAGEWDQAAAHFKQSQSHWQAYLNPLPEGDREACRNCNRPTAAEPPEGEDSKTPQTPHLRLAVIGVHQALNQVLAAKEHEGKSVDLAAVQEPLHRSYEQFLAADAPQFAQKLQESSLMQLIQALREAEVAEAKGDIHGAIAPLVRASQQFVFALPHLGLRGLEQLQRLYFTSQDYRNAFKIAQQQHQLERYCGKRAFIGANRLEEMPQQQSTSSWRSPEIEQSGRAEDVKHLLNRLHERQNKLLVVHGESGVGKSSLVNAGLLPILREQVFEGGRGGVPIVLRVYENWSEQLTEVIEQEGQKHFCRLDKREDGTSPLAVSQAILVELEKHHHQVILVFDQFEEFFFANPNPKDHHQFFNFLGTLCSNILELGALKVILSLRTDYIHRLLVCNRISTMACISQNILDKTVLYELNNLSPQQARQVIANLAPHIADDLRSRLVQDLQQKSEEIRPIELQVVGYQLESEGIVSLADYNALGEHPKQALVERYLDVVVESCGPQNKDLADAVLYLLTDERGTRPLRTRRDLLHDLKLFEKNYGQQSLSSALNLVLDIIAESRLVFLIPGQQERYQLVHDYLAEFIHQSRGGGLLAQLEEEQAKRVAAESSLEELDQKQARVTRRIRWMSAVGGLIIALSLGTLAWSSREVYIARSTTELERNSRLALKQFAENDELPALLRATATARRLQTLPVSAQNYPTVQPIQSLSKILQDSRFQYIYENHSSWVVDLDFNDNNNKFISISWDGTLKLWDVETGEEIHSFNGHSDRVVNANFNQDGTQIVSASWDETVKSWDVETGEEIHSFNGHSDRVVSAEFNQDGTQVVSASWDETVKLWDVKTGEEIHSFNGHSDRVVSAEFNQDGTQVVSASGDGTAKLWDVETGELLHSFDGHLSRVNSARFNNDGTRVVSTSWDQTLKLWDTETGEELHSFDGHGSGVNSAKFNRDNTQVISTSNNGITKFWNVKTGAELSSFEESWYPALHSDGMRFVSASTDGTIKLWNMSIGEQIHSFEKHLNRLRGSKFNHDGTKAVSISSDRTIKLWDVRSGELIYSFAGHSGEIMSVAFNRDDTRIVSTSSDGTAKLWDVETGEEIQSFDGHSGTVWNAVFNHDATRVVSASEDATAKLWDVETGEELQSFEGHLKRVWTVAFNEDGTKILSASEDATVKLWDVETGELLQSFEGHQYWVRSATFYDQDRKIMSASEDASIKLWDVETGEELRSLESHQAWVNSAEFNHDETKIVSASGDTTVKLWDVATGEELYSFEEHYNGVNTAVFNREGTMVVSASSDGMVKLWDVEIGEELHSFTGHTDGVVSAEFNPDGTQVISASLDTTAKIWKVETLNGLIDRACDWLTPYLTSNPNVTDDDRAVCNLPPQTP
ncbi:MAG: AAA family ATPase [Cyanobacteriota bacterium]